MDARVREIPESGKPMGREMKSRASRRSHGWREEGRGESVTAKGLLKFRAEQKATSVIDALNGRRNNVSKDTETGSFEAIFETCCS